MTSMACMTMIMMISLLASISSVPCVHAASDVVILTDQTFDDKLATGAWLVEFYAPWCGHCKTLEPIWEELANTLRGQANIAKVDCIAQDQLRQDYGVDSFPTIKLFHKGVVTDFRSRRTVGSFIDFLEKHGVIREEGAKSPVVQTGAAAASTNAVNESLKHPPPQTPKRPPQSAPAAPPVAAVPRVPVPPSPLSPSSATYTLANKWNTAEAPPVAPPLLVQTNTPTQAPNQRTIPASPTPTALSPSQKELPVAREPASPIQHTTTTTINELLSAQQVPDTIGTRPYQLRSYMHRGDAEPLRLILQDLAIDYDDIRYSSHTWSTQGRSSNGDMNKVWFWDLPLFSGFERPISHMSSILRSFGRKWQLYGNTEAERNDIDDIIASVEAIRAEFWLLVNDAPRAFNLGRQAFVDERVQRWLIQLQSILYHRTQDLKYPNLPVWLMGSSITIADYIALDTIHMFIGLDEHCLSALPRVLSYHNQFLSRPRIAAYLSDGTRRNPSVTDEHAAWGNDAHPPSPILPTYN